MSVWTSVCPFSELFRNKHPPVLRRCVELVFKKQNGLGKGKETNRGAAGGAPDVVHAHRGTAAWDTEQ